MSGARWCIRARRVFLQANISLANIYTMLDWAFEFSYFKICSIACLLSFIENIASLFLVGFENTGCSCIVYRQIFCLSTLSKTKIYQLKCRAQVAVRATRVFLQAHISLANILYRVEVSDMQAVQVIQITLIHPMQRMLPSFFPVSKGSRDVLSGFQLICEQFLVEVRRTGIFWIAKPCVATGRCNQ